MSQLTVVGQEVLTGLVATHERITPDEATNISLQVDISGEQPTAGVNDVVFVYVSITDANRNLVYSASDQIYFELEGEGKLIGNNPISAEASIATTLVVIGDKLQWPFKFKELELANVQQPRKEVALKLFTSNISVEKAGFYRKKHMNQSYSTLIPTTWNISACGYATEVGQNSRK